MNACPYCWRVAAPPASCPLCGDVAATVSGQVLPLRMRRLAVAEPAAARHLRGGPFKVGQFRVLEVGKALLALTAAVEIAMEPVRFGYQVQARWRGEGDVLHGLTRPFLLRRRARAWALWLAEHGHEMPEVIGAG